MRARMWPAWYYLRGIHATDKFDMRARSACVASWDRKVEEQVLVYLRIRKSARDDHLNMFVDNHLVFHGFMLTSLRKQHVPKDSDMRARMWPALYYLIVILTSCTYSSMLNG